MINMKKAIGLLISTLIFCNCATNTNTLNKIVLNEYEVTKIDSIDNYYLIYTQDSKSRYKIVSRKNIKTFNPDDLKSISKVRIKKINKRVIVNMKYKFELEELDKKSDSISKTQMNYYEFTHCVNLYPATKICTEPGYRLYKALNLDGLNYVNNKK